MAALLLSVAAASPLRAQEGPAAWVPAPDPVRDLLAEAIERVVLGPPGGLHTLEALLRAAPEAGLPAPAGAPLTLPDLPRGFGSGPGLHARSRPRAEGRAVAPASFASLALTAEHVARTGVHAPPRPVPEAFRPARLQPLPESPALLPVRAARPKLPRGFLLGPSPALALRSRILDFDSAAGAASRALVIGIEIGF